MMIYVFSLQNQGPKVQLAQQSLGLTPFSPEGFWIFFDFSPLCCIALTDSETQPAGTSNAPVLEGLDSVSFLISVYFSGARPRVFVLSNVGQGWVLYLYHNASLLGLDNSSRGCRSGSGGAL